MQHQLPGYTCGVALVEDEKVHKTILFFVVYIDKIFFFIYTV